MKITWIQMVAPNRQFMRGGGETCARTWTTVYKVYTIYVCVCVCLYIRCTYKERRMFWKFSSLLTTTRICATVCCIRYIHAVRCFSGISSEGERCLSAGVGNWYVARRRCLIWADDFMGLGRRAVYWLNFGISSWLGLVFLHCWETRSWKNKFICVT